jgi:hypothetical protein
VSDEIRKPHISASGLEMLERCGIQYDFRYNQGLRKPPGFAAHKGTGVHRGAAHNLATIIATEQPAELEECLEIAAETVRNEVLGQGVMLSEEEKSIGVKKLTGDAVDSAVRLSKVHYEELAPTINPTSVEREIVLEIPDFDYDILGYIDVVSDEGTTVRDLKTSGKSPAEDAAHRSTQLTVYAFAVEVIDDKRVQGVCLDFVVDLKKGPIVKTVMSTRHKGHYASFLDSVYIAGNVIKSGAFMPAPPSAWWCAENWCGYFAECPYGRRRLTQYTIGAI